MSHANGLSPFRGKVNQFIIPVSHFKRSTPKTSVPQKGVVAEPPVQYTPQKEDRVQTAPSTTEKKQAFSPPKFKIEKPWK